MTIGRKLKQARLKKELTQENIANILNVSRSTISNWEIGRSYPDLESVVALSDLYNISLDELLREDDDMVRKLSNDSKVLSKLIKISRIICVLFVFLFLGMTLTNAKERIAEKRYHYWFNEGMKISKELSNIIKNKDINNIDSYKTDVDKLIESKDILFIRLYPNKEKAYKFSNKSSDKIFEYGKLREGKEYFGGIYETDKNNKNQSIYFIYRTPENKIFEIYPLIHKPIIYATPLAIIGYIGIEIINKRRTLNK
ncbi:MAG: helix-turn-helix domain-containing protein [Paraclostridium sordellii]|uniref:DNA-binding protein n=1 Tax=Paraclostridium sordellii TaxID=1505 RepID=A0A0C7LIP7_PARSO|nr:helix-turn-helix transcriptional regulator [Paeniclostridium sordellii]QYE99773.1 helix-turn-helix domain-containing protein [Paeniclostridium sordellii]CEP41750.1 DNA-binding protein [[Clostridium] sordellii] [Paeniclostridium sordellii]